MMAINGRIQREGDVVHLVAEQLFDVSGDLCLADRARVQAAVGTGTWGGSARTDGRGEAERHLHAGSAYRNA